MGEAGINKPLVDIFGMIYKFKRIKKPVIKLPVQIFNFFLNKSRKILFLFILR
jgi:hypothetical protein